MKKKSFFTLSAFFALSAFFIGACAPKSKDVIYRPSPHILPTHIKKLAIKPFENRTQQFALEDKLTIRVNNRFITDSTYRITSIEESDGILMGVINRYIHLPIAYDANLVATQYKLDVVVQISFIDRAANTVMW